MVRAVTVEVAGQKLGIRTDATDAELTELTELVNSRFNEIRDAARNAPPLKVALLATLAIADELRLVSNELRDLKSSVQTEAQGALAFLEEDDAPDA